MDSRIVLQGRATGYREVPALEAGTSGVVSDDAEGGKNPISKYIDRSDWNRC